MRTLSRSNVHGVELVETTVGGFVLVCVDEFQLLGEVFRQTGCRWQSSIAA